MAEIILVEGLGQEKPPTPTVKGLLVIEREGEGGEREGGREGERERERKGWRE